MQKNVYLRPDCDSGMIRVACAGWIVTEGSVACYLPAATTAEAIVEVVTPDGSSVSKGGKCIHLRILTLTM